MSLHPALPRLVTQAEGARRGKGTGVFSWIRAGRTGGFLFAFVSTDSFL